jgi:hypothetical protein
MTELQTKEIAFPEGAVFWVAYDPESGTYHHGVTLPDQVTTSGQPHFEVTENEMDWLNTMADMPIEFPDLPEVGETVYAKEVYKHGENLIICRQTHERTIHNPSDVPALWGIYRKDNPDEYLEWVPNEDVLIGTMRMDNGQLYRGIQAHFTLEGWNPSLTPALWQLHQEPQEGCPDWIQPFGAHDAYQVNDCVTFDGQEWLNTIPNNVWQPGVVGWELKQS